MPIIKNREIVEDTWSRVSEEATVDTLPEGNVIVPLSLWKSEKAHLLARQGKLGIQLESDIDLNEIREDLPHFDVVALNFPAFKDGRHYSNARLLRQRYNYRGEIRAVGDVLRDQLFFMERVGFDAFELRADRDMDDALNAFSEFTVRYQAATDEPRPLFKRR